MLLGQGHSPLLNFFFNEACSCQKHNFVMHGGIWKKSDTYDHHDKTVYHEQEPCRSVKGRFPSLHWNSVHRFQWNLFVSAHNLVIYVGIYK